MARLTPPLGTKGRYVVNAPFVTDPTTLYTCAAVRSFRDIRERGFDPFTEFYEPAGLTQEQYTADVEAGAAIITLTSDTQPVIYIPDTYILSYPNLEYVPYNHVILSLSLGMVPDYLDFSFLKDQVAAVCSDVIGVESNVNLHIAPTTDVVTSDQHDILETARLQAIALRDTDRALYLAEAQKNAALLEQIATLEQIIKNNGLI